jgi:hypothetical protein
MGYRSAHLFLAKPTLARQSYSRFLRLMIKMKNLTEISGRLTRGCDVMNFYKDI